MNSFIVYKFFRYETKRSFSEFRCFKMRYYIKYSKNVLEKSTGFGTMNSSALITLVTTS